MNATQLKEDLVLLKTRLESIEGQLEGQLKELEIREEKWKRVDDQVNELLKSSSEIVKLNVGGKKFQTRKETILNKSDSLLARIIESERVDLNEELFFDRSSKYFPYILDYLRFNKINYKRFKKEELKELQEEVEFYEISDIVKYLRELSKEIEYIHFESSGVYTYNGAVAGTNKVADIKDKSLTKGICANTPGWIIIELNAIWEFEEIEIAGFNGNSNAWYAGNGSGATISTSQDKLNWTKVGSIPSNYGSTIVKVKLTKTKAKYIKFENKSYLGIGFLNIKKC